MNEVSWFLYLIDVIYSLANNVFVPMGLFSVLGSIIIIGLSMIYETERDYENHNYVYKRVFIFTHLRAHLYYLVPMAIISILIISIIPSKTTLYAIVASQVGEQIIQLEEVQDIGGEAGGLAKDAIELLRQQISEQLTEKPAE